MTNTIFNIRLTVDFCNFAIYMAYSGVDNPTEHTCAGNMFSNSSSLEAWS